MEKSWEITGATATWKMTVEIGEGVFERELDFDGLAEHFRTLVDLGDAYWRLNQVG
ncbi:MAG: hypothetical protein HOV94_28355 [Saccharothrix sp.]|nr:hypothetical protein [Saccharothrix sp.]